MERETMKLWHYLEFLNLKENQLSPNTLTESIRSNQNTIYFY